MRSASRGHAARSAARRRLGHASGPGWNKAKSIILIYLQGGPSHIDLWDPKDDVPDNVRSVFKKINSKVPGMEVTELLPKFAEVTDKVTMIRSMSYTPNGLFNHTAAIIESAYGRASMPAHVARGKIAQTSPVMLPRPLQESNVVNKSGTAGFLGRAYDPYYLFPNGDDMDMNKMEKVKVDDLTLRPEVSETRLDRRARLRDLINKGMPEIDKAVEKYDLNKYYESALTLISSGRAREAFSLDLEKVANSDNHSWDVHTGLTNRMKNQSAPMLDAGLSALLADMDDRGLLEETLVVCVGEFGRSPQRGVSTSGNGNSDDGRDHWPYCYTAVLAGAGIKRGHVHGKSDQTASAPLENPVHPTELLATMYHAVGIHPQTIVYNHLNQPRELVKGEAVTKLFS